jgi:hypothetical protein
VQHHDLLLDVQQVEQQADVLPTLESRVLVVLDLVLHHPQQIKRAWVFLLQTCTNNNNNQAF